MTDDTEGTVQASITDVTSESDDEEGGEESVAEPEDEAQQTFDSITGGDSGGSSDSVVDDDEEVEHGEDSKDAEESEALEDSDDGEEDTQEDVGGSEQTDESADEEINDEDVDDVEPETSDDSVNQDEPETSTEEPADESHVEEPEDTVQDNQIEEDDDEGEVDSSVNGTGVSNVSSFESVSVSETRDRILNDYDGSRVSAVQVLVLLSLHGVVDMGRTVLMWVKDHSLRDIADGCRLCVDEITPEKDDDDVLIAAFVYLSVALVFVFIVLGLVA